MNSPLVSIVIANYNYGRFLEDAIQSIASQDSGGCVELIVCDAGSSDNSVEVIRKYAAGLPPNVDRREWHGGAENVDSPNSPISWWCSEKDGGQSAAFNKGFSHAHGRFLTWLNADDIMLPGVVKKLAESVRQHPECEWFTGGCIHVDPMLRIFKCVRSRQMSSYRARHGMVNVSGPSSFFSRDLYERVGKIDERFQYAMDIDLWVRFALLAQQSFIPFVRYAWALRLHPEAKMSGHKFTADGKILDGAASRVAYVKNKSRLEQLDREREWTREKISIPKIGIGHMMRWLTTSACAVALSRFDSWRFHGLPLQNIPQ